MQQNRELRNRPRQVYLIDFFMKAQKQSAIHKQKYYPQTKHHTLYKNELKMGHRSKPKA